MYDLLTRHLWTLEPRQRRTALGLVEPAEADVATVLMRPGERDPSLLYVRAGRLSVRTDQVPLADAQPEHVVGAEQVYGDPTRVFHVSAATPVSLYVVEHRAMERARMALPGVARILELSALVALADRLEDLDARIVAHAGTLLREHGRQTGQPLPLLGELFTDGVSHGPPVPWQNSSGDPVPDAQGALTGLGPWLQSVRVRAGQPLARQGEPGGSVLFVVEGRVEVFARVEEDTVVRLGQRGPAVVGLSAVLRGAGHLATCVARDDVRALAIPADECRALLGLEEPEGAALRVACIRALAAMLPGARDQVQCSARCMRVAIHDRLYEASAGA